MKSSPAPTNPESTRQLAQFVAELRWEAVPSHVVEYTKLCVLDAIGCGLFGSRLPWTRILIDTIMEQGGSPQASIWGTSHRTSITQAALANCAAGHSFELDDLHTTALIHATTLSVPVALAFAERDGSDGREMLIACIAGFEVGLRVGIAGTHGLFNRGFHPQGTSGVFCGAATGARMLRLDAQATQHALGIAASMASGLMAAQEGAMSKRLHGGHGGQAGALAALLAQRGYTGIPDALEKEKGGFLSTYSNRPAPECLTTGLGSQWETLAIGFKAYPTVSLVHSPIKLLGSIMLEQSFQSGDIASLRIKCGTHCFNHTAWPYRATGLTEAQMNMYYSLAVMAIHGEVFVDQFREDRLADPDILGFMKKISVEIDPAVDALGPRFQDAVTLELRTNDGRSFVAERKYRPGSPEDPLTPTDLRAKFRRLAEGRWPRDKTEKIIELIDRLDALPSVLPLAECLRELPEVPMSA